MERLNGLADSILAIKKNSIGYPVNQNTELKEFYQWYLNSGLYDCVMNNVGDPQKKASNRANTHIFENEVIDFFADLFHFPENGHWGFTTASGTDGNSHGIYFGKKHLQEKSSLPPILYVSSEAHFSIKRLADVQKIEFKIVPSLPMGQMDLKAFGELLDPKRPALIVSALGTTFKGAIDDQEEMRKIAEKKGVKHSFWHMDGALFGSILGFSSGPGNELVNFEKLNYDSIAISGHKFFGLDDPMGIFLINKGIMHSIKPFQVNYLGSPIPTINCSRSSLGPLKLWWKIKRKGQDTYQKESDELLKRAKALNKLMRESGIKSWLNPYSNTVFFPQPSDYVMRKYSLAPEYDENFGGDLAHILVMQHVDYSIMSEFISDYQKS